MPNDRKCVLCKGQSLFEVLIVIAISALIIVAIVSMTTNSIQNSTFAKNNALASTYVQQASEWLRGQRDSDTNTFITYAKTVGASNPGWCLKDLSWPAGTGLCASNDYIFGTIFIRQATFVVVPSNGKNLVTATISVSWKDSKGTHNVTSTTYLSD